MLRQFNSISCIFLIFCSFSCNFFTPVEDEIYTGDGQVFFTFNFRKNQIDKIIAVERRVLQSNIEIYVEKKYNNSISDSTIHNIANSFQNDIYDLIKNKFGEESDVDNNSKVTFLLLDIQDDYDPTCRPNYSAGFFNSRDLLNLPKSNQKDMLYIDINPADPTSDCIKKVIAHEFQHLVNFNERRFKRNLSSQETWINEGLSTAAEHLYNREWVPYVTNYYFNDPTNDIALGQRFLSWGRSQNTFINYVMVNIFYQWMRIHYSGGDALYKQIIQDSGTDYSVVTRLFGNPIGLNNWTEIMQQFNLALFYNKTNNLQGFRNEGPVSLGNKLLKLNNTNNVSIQLMPGEALFVGNSMSIVDIIKSNRSGEGANIGYYAIRKGNIVGEGVGNYTNIDFMLILNGSTSPNGPDELIGDVQIKGGSPGEGSSRSIRGVFEPRINAHWIPSEYEKINRLSFDINGNLIR